MMNVPLRKINYLLVDGDGHDDGHGAPICSGLVMMAYGVRWRGSMMMVSGPSSVDGWVSGEQHARYGEGGNNGRSWCFQAVLPA